MAYIVHGNMELVYYLSNASKYFRTKWIQNVERNRKLYALSIQIAFDYKPKASFTFYILCQSVQQFFHSFRWRRRCHFSFILFLRCFGEKDYFCFFFFVFARALKTQILKMPSEWNTCSMFNVRVACGTKQYSFEQVMLLYKMHGNSNNAVDN